MLLDLSSSALSVAVLDPVPDLSLSSKDLRSVSVVIMNLSPIPEGYVIKFLIKSP